MKLKSKLIAAATALALTAPALAAAETTTIGVSIPAPTHGWAQGMNWHANQAKKRLEAAYPNVKIVLELASDPSDQANDLEDMVSVHNIDGLVILPLNPNL